MYNCIQNYVYVTSRQVGICAHYLKYFSYKNRVEYILRSNLSC